MLRLINTFILTLILTAASAATIGNLRPVGEGRGVYPGRVVWSHTPGMASHPTNTPDWFSDRYIRQSAADSMMRNAIADLVGTNDPATAWRESFRATNRRLHRGDHGYRPGDKIVVKIDNPNSTSHYNSPNFNTTPQAVLALIRTLVKDGNVDPADITIADPAHYITDAVYERCHSEYRAIRFVDCIGGNGRQKATFVPGVIRYAHRVPNLPAGVEQSFVDAKYIINMATLSGDSDGYPSLCGANWLGTLGNSNGPLKSFSTPLAANGFSPLVELMAADALGDKCILYIVDGILGSQRGKGKPSHKWTSSPFDGDWPSSVLASFDPVAIDIVALDLLEAEFDMVSNSDAYLREAALIGMPQAAASYAMAAGRQSLGVAEHGRLTASEAFYSRNLGRNEGIELRYLALND